MCRSMTKMLSIELPSNHTAFELVGPSANRCAKRILTSSGLLATDNRDDITVSVKPNSDMGHT